MAQASNTTSEESYREAVGRVRNEAGMEAADAELQRIREEENGRSGPPADLPKSVRKAMEREGLL